MKSYHVNKLQSENERIKKQTEKASFLALVDEYKYLRSVLEDHCIARSASAAHQPTLKLNGVERFHISPSSLFAVNHSPETAFDWISISLSQSRSSEATIHYSRLSSRSLSNKFQNLDHLEIIK
jgi:hypothetical protein